VASLAAEPAAPAKPESVPPVSGTQTLPTAVPSAPEPATVPSVPAVITATVATSSPPDSTAGASGGNPPGGAKLLLEFSNDCWVEVKDAQGNVLASGLMKANSTRTLSGSAPFKVTLGNAPAARIILDDRLVDTQFYLPRRGTVSRFTLDRDQP
jgi:cytoskeleton protein RodZ